MKSLNRKFPVLVAILLSVLSINVCFAAPLEEEVNRLISGFNAVTDEELDTMNRQTVGKCTTYFGQSVKLIEEIAKSDLSILEKRTLSARLVVSMARFFRELSAPYENVSAEPITHQEATAGAKSKWEFLVGSAGYLGMRALYTLENVFRDFSRAFIPMRRDIHGEFRWSVPPIFPFLGNDWARSDATDPMMHSILERIEKAQGHSVSENEKRSLEAYAAFLEEVSNSEPIQNGARNSRIRAFELWWAPLQNLHPIDVNWWFGCQSENSTWVWGAAWTVLFYTFAKARLENSGLKAYWHWTRAKELLSKVMPVNCYEALLIQNALVSEGEGTVTELEAEPGKKTRRRAPVGRKTS